MRIKKREEDYTSDCIPTGAMRNARNKIEFEKEIILANIEQAKRNRLYFKSHSIYVVNLLSSPGAGKTMILESTLKCIESNYKPYVIVGDFVTDIDFKKIKNLGVSCLQVNTNCGGYLDADMVYEAVRKLKVKDNSILFIENVGNLLSPAHFDLGESLRVIVSSVTEGEDKPLKFPYMYETANLCLVNKIDLLNYLKMNINILKKNIALVNSQIDIIEVSALTGLNIDEWCNYLLQRIGRIG